MAFVAALPALSTRYPVSTDLPQHLAQLRLAEAVGLGEAPTDQFRVTWIAPNTAVYVMMVPLWRSLSPHWTGRIALGLLVASWVGATFLLAWGRRRSITSAILAGVFAYSVSVSWGFLNFLIGYPAFAAWWLIAARPLTSRRWLLLIGMSAVLLWSHALWFAFSCFVLAGLVAVERTTLREALAKLTTALPVGLVSIVWVRGVAARRSQIFSTDPVWTTSFADRLSPRVWAPAAIHTWHWILAIVLLVWVGWLVGGAIATRRTTGSTIDRPLLMTALIAGVIYLLGPDRFLNTEFFAARWIPLALIWLTLALPAPKVGALLTYVGSTLTMLVLIAHITLTWKRVGEVELTGLDESLMAVPANARVVGLDYVQHSRFTPGFPFLNVAAWATVLQGADTDFSFAEHGNGVVQYRAPRVAPWTRSISGDARTIRPEDYAHFDFALVNTLEGGHETYARAAPVEPVTETGRWRLYRITSAD